MINKIICKLIFFIKIFEYKVRFKKSLEIGSKFSFRKRFNLNINSGGKLVVGEKVFFNNDCSINCKNKISIGNNCIFGENVKIYDHNHKFSDYTKLILEQGYKLGEIYIGDNCWIGSNVVILPGAIVKSNSIIGAGCIVSGEIPEGVIVTPNRELNIIRRNK